MRSELSGKSQDISHFGKNYGAELVKAHSKASRGCAEVHTEVNAAMLSRAMSVCEDVSAVNATVCPAFPACQV